MASADFLVARRFSEIQDQKATPKVFSPQRLGQPLHAFDDPTALVLLGDSGAGKSTAFEGAAKATEDGLYCSARDFITFNQEKFLGKTLFIDGLDEVRATQSDKIAPFDEIRGKLDALGKPRFRLSCREADWFAALDRDALKAVSADGDVVLIRIDPLTDDEIAAIVEAWSGNDDVDPFITKAKTRGILELLRNPQNLKMMLRAVSGGQWPNTRTETFELACQELVSEVNPIHAHAPQEEAATARLLKAASQLCAVQLCANAAGFALSETAGDDTYPWIGHLGSNVELLRIVGRRNLFRSEGPERRTPSHRSIAEFLAARYLTELVRNGLPIARVLALVSGHDGRPVSDLRGLFAWLACLCPEHFELLVDRDSPAIVQYGDVAPLSRERKVRLLSALQSEAVANPWFRSSQWVASPFSALCTPDMEEPFREALVDPRRDDSTQIHVDGILEAITHGTPLPSLGDVLLQVVRDDSRWPRVRSSTVRALWHVCLNPTVELKQLLEDVHDNKIADADDDLRGTILQLLYPDALSPSTLTRYLTPPRRGELFGAYKSFRVYFLPRYTNGDAIAKVLDSLASASAPSDWRSDHSEKRMVGELLTKGLEETGDRVSVEQLYSWSGLGLDKYDLPRLDGEHEEIVRSWLTARPDLVLKLIEHGLSEVIEDQGSRRLFKVMQRLHGATLPAGFGRWLLERANMEEDTTASHLFRDAVAQLWRRDGIEDVTIDELFDFAETRPHFRRVLKRMMVCQLSDNHFQHKTEIIDRRIHNEINKANFLKKMKINIETIADGINIGYLDFLARIYFGFCTDIDQDCSPRARLQKYLADDELVRAALSGFRAVTRRIDLPGPVQIAEAQAEGQSWTTSLPVLAGVNELTAADPAQIFSLTESQLASCLCSRLSHPYDEEPDWLIEVLRQRPAIVANILEQYWSILLQKKIHSINTLYHLAHNDRYTNVAKLLSTFLIKKFPRCDQINFSYLCAAALRHGDQQVLLEIAETDLRRKSGLTVGRRITWLTTCFLINPDCYADPFTEYCISNKKRAMALARFVSGHIASSRHLIPLENQPVQVLKVLIEIIGSYFRRVRVSGTVTTEQEAGELVASLIEQLSQREGEEVLRCIDRLAALPKLAAWQPQLLRVAAEQKRVLRESSFRHPSVEKIVEVLGNGRPQNVADLAALLGDHLTMLAEEIRHGDTDGYKKFWNVDRFGKPDRPPSPSRERLPRHFARFVENASGTNEYRLAA